MDIAYFVVNALLFSVPFGLLVIKSLYLDLRKANKEIDLRSKMYYQLEKEKFWLDEVPEETVKVMLKSLAEHHGHEIEEGSYRLVIGGEIHGTVVVGADLWREGLKMHAKYAHINSKLFL